MKGGHKISFALGASSGYNWCNVLFWNGKHVKTNVRVELGLIKKTHQKILLQYYYYVSRRKNLDRDFATTTCD